MQGKIVLEQDVVNVLDRANISATALVLPDKLDRTLYVKVNKALEALGGKWDKKAKAHLFVYDPATAIDNAILTGYVVDNDKALDFFETPAAVGDAIADLLAIEPHHSVLEPSAGKGAIIDRLRWKGVSQVIHAVEIDSGRCKILAHQPNVDIFYEDFLMFQPQPPNMQGYHRIAANPPFSGRMDLAHVAHMWALLLPGDGRLVSVMTNSVKTRSDRKGQAFRDLFRGYRYDFIDLPENSFKDSGTGVNTVLFVAEKH